MDGQSSGYISGGAQGAVSGAMAGTYILPGWGTVIGGVIGGIGGALLGGSSGSNDDENFAVQQAWAKYNAQTGYDTNMANIMSQTMLSAFNANMIQQAAQVKAQSITDVATWNADMLHTVVEYNDDLMEQELDLLWEAEDLDLELLHQQRREERGVMLAGQSASGTVMDTGSNLEVIVGQKTQEALDALVVQHNADIQADKINNSRAQSRWEGEVAVQKTLWEGEMGAYLTNVNADFQAGSMIASAGVNALSSMASAKSALQSGTTSIAMNEATYEDQNTQKMVAGLYSAGSRAVSAIASNAAAGSGAATGSGGGVGSDLLASGSSSSYTWNTGYSGNYTL